MANSRIRKKLYYLLASLVLVLIFREEFLPDSPVEHGQVISESDELTFRVVKVVDGDTIRIISGGQEETVRLIGIDTPETVDPRREVECFGREAALAAKDLLEEREVRLEADETQSDRDRYGRLLRYVHVKDGTDVNLWLIQNGYAFEYTYQSPYLRQEEYRRAQNSARASGVGLWNPQNCRVP